LGGKTGYVGKEHGEHAIHLFGELKNDPGDISGNHFEPPDS
jgi:hypothetical protein